ncbi:cache domain-containing protein [Plasticicumulans acidivorans]|uniref:Single cache domain-containing protein n=1 Tax=Plasticicumulans acidivorans TaxID=886464 RepID=A0A317MTL2_9GAMM|nr:cache domain-containing protein [Plasticicumulans acidivorans]PWV60638.1 single cache domain-containing protein [Plasticicumulans acidivorans]
MKAVKFLSALMTSTVLAFSMVSAAHAWSTEKEARTLLKDAETYIQEKGQEAALAEFSKNPGPFVRNDLYVFALDEKGNYLASGADSRLIGKPIMAADAAGNPVGPRILEVANKSPAGGDVEYMWLNRSVNKVQKKVSHVKRVGDIVIGVGNYLPNN